jgi:hypothetical protein
MTFVSPRSKSSGRWANSAMILRRTGSNRSASGTDANCRQHRVRPAQDGITNRVSRPEACIECRMGASKRGSTLKLKSRRGGVAYDSRNARAGTGARPRGERDRVEDSSQTPTRRDRRQRLSYSSQYRHDRVQRRLGMDAPPPDDIGPAMRESACGPRGPACTRCVRAVQPHHSRRRRFTVMMFVLARHPSGRSRPSRR